MFDSSDSLTMITLSLGVLLKVRGEPPASEQNQTFLRQCYQKPELKSTESALSLDLHYIT